MIERLEFVPLTGQIHEIYRKQKDPGENGRATAETCVSTYPGPFMLLWTEVVSKYSQTSLTTTCSLSLGSAAVHCYG